jgi:hypothetical protein
MGYPPLSFAKAHNVDLLCRSMGSIYQIPRDNLTCQHEHSSLVIISVFTSYATSETFEYYVQTFTFIMLQTQ